MQHAAAQSDLNRVVALNSRYKNNHIERALIYSSLNQDELAISDYTEVIELNSTDAIAFRTAQ